MNLHPFDRFAVVLAHGISRRTFLNLLAQLAAGTAAYKLLPGPPIALARSAGQQDAHTPQPPGYWPPEAEFPLGWLRVDPQNNVQLTTALLAAEGGSGPASWCEMVESIVNSAFPHITGLAEVATPFGEDCGTTDCLQCCYVPSTNSCHSSYIGEDVINCSPKVYGQGTRGVGMTLLLQEPPPDGTCLFTPQVCTHVGMCLQQTISGLSSTHYAAQADPPDYLTDPRAIKQRARVFATYALTQVRRYLDEYATDSPDSLPLQSLEDAVFGRGWATWRQDMAGLTFDLNDPLFRVTDGAGNLLEDEARANVWRVFALLRLLTGLPNLAARLEYIESRVWSAADKAGYLASMPDPDAVLAESLDPHMVDILKRIPSLQDYQLFAVPLAGEPDASDRYGGMLLGQAPTLSLSATVVDSTATLTATLDDPTAGVGELARPLALDWGDGRVTQHEFPAGQTTLTVGHDYAAAGRYAIYAVAANNSGLRGAACVVIEVHAGHAAPSAPAPLTLVRAGLSGLMVLNLPFTRDLRLELAFADTTDRQFRGGRSRIASGPTNITLPVDLGVAYAHNPARVEVTQLIIEPQHNLVAPSGTRIPALTLASLSLGVFSTAQMRPVEQVLNLSVSTLAVYVADDPAPLPESALTVNSDGTITVPLLYRANSSAPWQRIERIAIGISPAMFDGFVLDATPTPLPVGINVAWIERRPGAFTRIIDAPPPTQEPPSTTPTPPGAPPAYRVYLPGVQR